MGIVGSEFVVCQIQLIGSGLRGRSSSFCGLLRWYRVLQGRPRCQQLSGEAFQV